MKLYISSNLLNTALTDSKMRKMIRTLTQTSYEDIVTANLSQEEGNACIKALGISTLQIVRGNQIDSAGEVFGHKWNSITTAHPASYTNVDQIISEEDLNTVYQRTYSKLSLVNKVILFFQEAFHFLMSWKPFSQKANSSEKMGPISSNSLSSSSSLLDEGETNRSVMKESPTPASQGEIEIPVLSQPDMEEQPSIVETDLDALLGEKSRAHQQTLKDNEIAERFKDPNHNFGQYFKP